MGQKNSTQTAPQTFRPTEDFDYPVTPPSKERERGLSKRFHFGRTSSTSSSSGPSDRKGNPRDLPPIEQSDVPRVPTVFRWKGGGKRVYLAGTFNGWQGRIPLAKSGDNFMAIVDVPIGHHDFKYIVDGEWRWDKDAPTVADPQGNVNNTIVVTTRHPILETLNQEEMERSNSVGNYDNLPEVFLEDKKNPPSLPPQLKLTMLNFNTGLILPIVVDPSGGGGSSGGRRSFESPEVSPLASQSVSRSQSRTQSTEMSHTNSGDVATVLPPMTTNSHILSEPNALSQRDVETPVRVSKHGSLLRTSDAQGTTDLSVPFGKMVVQEPQRKSSRAEDPAATPAPHVATMEHVYFYDPSASGDDRNVLGVGCTFRYKGKFANVMLYKSVFDEAPSQERENEILLAFSSTPR